MVDELARRRFDQSRNPNDHRPLDALKAMVADIEAGELDVRHVVICYQRSDDENRDCGYYQAGEAKVAESIGICTRVAQLIGGCGNHG